MKKILLIIILLSLTRFSEAQNIPSDLLKNYSILNEANSDFFNEKYQIAYDKYRQIQNDNRVNYLSIHNYIKCCIKLGLINEAKKNIEYCISNFGIRYSVFNNNNYGIEKDDKRFIDIKEKEQVLLNNFYTIGRISEIKLLEHYFRTDMFMSIDMSNFNISSKCDEYKIVSEEIKYIHDTTYTLPYLRQLIKKYNFPNAYDIGDESDDYFYLLIRHNIIDSSIYNKALFNGKISPYDYASIMDYHYNWDFKTRKPKQNYGPNLTKIDNVMTIGYIDDIEHVDERRAKIGLQPLWQLAKLSKRPFKLSKEYILVLKKNGIIFE